MQKRLPFRPTIRQTKYLYELLNHEVFSDKLKTPIIDVAPRRRKYWGMCIGSYEKDHTGSYCRIDLMDKYFSVQWFVTILAHEMSHQYQWDIIGPEREIQGKDPIMSHGPSFFTFREQLAEHYIPIKSAHSMRKWFKYQDLFKA